MPNWQFFYGCDDASSATTKFFVPQKQNMFTSPSLSSSLPSALSHSSQQSLASLALGGYGAVGSMHNFQGNLSARMLPAHGKGDMESSLLVQVCLLTLVCVLCLVCDSFWGVWFSLWQQRCQSVVSLMTNYSPQWEWEEWMQENELFTPSFLSCSWKCVFKAVLKIRGMDLGTPCPLLLPVSPKSLQLKSQEAELKF